MKKEKEKDKKPKKNTGKSKKEREIKKNLLKTTILLIIRLLLFPS